MGPAAIDGHPQVGCVVETQLHLLVVHHFRASELDFDSDTAESGTQLSTAAAV